MARRERLCERRFLGMARGGARTVRLGRWLILLLIGVVGFGGGLGWPDVGAQLPGAATVAGVAGHVVVVPAFAGADQVSRVTGTVVVRVTDTEVQFAVPGAHNALYREWLTFLAELDRMTQSAAGADTVLVRFGDDVTGAEALLFEHVTGARFVRRWTGLDAWEYTVPDGVKAPRFVQWLHLSPWVRWVEMNETMEWGPEEGAIGY